MECHIGCQVTLRDGIFTLEVHSEEAQLVTITDCHVGNPCEQRSDPTTLKKHPMIRGIKGRDQEERVTDFGA
ncbi:hypothetical protein Tco_1563334 [Tanacetum coccineum]